MRRRSARACCCWPCWMTRNWRGWRATPRSELAKIDPAVLKAGLMKLVAGSAEDEGPPARSRRAGEAGRCRPGGVSQYAGTGSVHRQPHRAGQEGRDRPGDRPRVRGPPDGRHPDPPPPEQPDPHRRGGRRQDGRRRGPGAADRPGRRAPRCSRTSCSAPSTWACSRPVPASRASSRTGSSR